MSSRELFPGIVSDTEILGGEVVIKGTRIPVSLILGHLAGDMSIEELLDEYDLRIEDIRAAFGYAAELIIASRSHRNFVMAIKLEMVAIWLAWLIRLCIGFWKSPTISSQ